MSELKSRSLRDFAKAEGFTAINPKVRVNANGYPFLTLVKPDGKGGSVAENIYFSKGSADTALGMETIDAETRGNLLVCEVTNEAGEKRLKLAFQGESSYEAI